MLNEGIVVNNTKTLMKSEIVRQLGRLGSTDPETLGRAVFHGVTGHSVDDVDWTVEDNHAGYYTWIRSFDGLISELEEDGYLTVEPGSDGTHTLHAVHTDPAIEYSHQAYPHR